MRRGRSLFGLHKLRANIFCNLKDRVTISPPQDRPDRILLSSKSPWGVGPQCAASGQRRLGSPCAQHTRHPKSAWGCRRASGTCPSKWSPPPGRCHWRRGPAFSETPEGCGKVTLELSRRRFPWESVSPMGGLKGPSERCFVKITVQCSLVKLAGQQGALFKCFGCLL